MIVPELTYNFQALKDTAGGLIQIVRREVSNAATNVQVTASAYTVPNDCVFILTSMNVRGSPGATQTANNVGCRLEEDGNSMPFAVGPDVDNATADTKIVSNWSGELWCPPGSILNGVGNFDAGVASNTITVRIFGVCIPRGNIQEG